MALAPGGRRAAGEHAAASSKTVPALAAAPAPCIATGAPTQCDGLVLEHLDLTQDVCGPDVHRRRRCEATHRGIAATISDGDP